MTIWTIADLHLSFGVPGKEMDLFGEKWKDHPQKIEANWRKLVSPSDLVLIPGDISWAMHIEDAALDLLWIDTLPGTKVMIRGNHDYWWHSISKVEKILPPSIHLVQNNCFLWEGIAIAGARLWDTPEYSFDPYVVYQDNPKANLLLEKENNPEAAEKIFVRELSRLELSLKSIPSHVKTRIVMTHYPPIGADLAPSRTSAILSKYEVCKVAFGHLHNVRANTLPFGEKDGIRYIFSSCDYVDFTPVYVY